MLLGETAHFTSAQTVFSGSCFNREAAPVGLHVKAFPPVVTTPATVCQEKKSHCVRPNRIPYQSYVYWTDWIRFTAKYVQLKKNACLCFSKKNVLCFNNVSSKWQLIGDWSSLQLSFYSLLSMINVLTSLHSVLFLALMRYDLVYCWRPHFSAALVRENVAAFSDFSFARHREGVVWAERHREIHALLSPFVILPWSEGTLLGGFVIFEQPSWIASCMIALHFFDPVQLWMTYIYRVFSLLHVKRSAEPILFLFI